MPILKHKQGVTGVLPAWKYEQSVHRDSARMEIQKGSVGYSSFRRSHYVNIPNNFQQLFYLNTFCISTTTITA